MDIDTNINDNLLRLKYELVSIHNYDLRDSQRDVKRSSIYKTTAI